MDTRWLDITWGSYQKDPQNLYLLADHGAPHETVYHHCDLEGEDNDSDSKTDENKNDTTKTKPQPKIAP
jgi:hypothetical protein